MFMQYGRLLPGRVFHVSLIILLIMIISISSFVILKQPVLANNVLTVTTNSDSGADATLDGSAVDPTDGLGLSLREAIGLATAGSTITFDNSLYGTTINATADTFFIYTDIILDGDLDNDGNPDITLSGNDIRKIFSIQSLSSSALFEGLIITHGSASDGGGMYIYGSSPTIRNCTFSYNSVSSPSISNGYGGAIICNTGSSPIITNCIFSNNTAQKAGGAIESNRSSPAIDNCVFSINTALYGGGIHLYESPATITDCTFTNNSATFDSPNGGDGGGVYNTRSSTTITTTISGCTFTNNSADNRGAGICNDDSYAVITGCTFTGNSAFSSTGNLYRGTGGGIFNLLCSSTITDCFFLGNSASTSGGGVHTWNMYYDGIDYSPAITNCVFSGNSAPYGGGMHSECYDPPSPSKVTNCTFSNNSADHGTAMSYYEGSGLITNCILWDGGDEIYVYWDESEPVINCTYSDIYQTSGTYSGTGNINEDPSFTDPAGDFHLETGSPCIDAGTNSGSPSEDIEGNLRPVDGDGNGISVTDMGAYEAPRLLSPSSTTPSSPPSEVAVGITVMPVDRAELLGLLVPWLALAALILISLFTLVIFRKRLIH